MTSKFNIGDIVTLTSEAALWFSRDNWAKYPVPKSLSETGGIVIGFKYEDYLRISVQTGAGEAFFLEDQLVLVAKDNDPKMHLYTTVNGDTVTVSGQPQYTGGSSDYYKVFVTNPTTLGEPYWAECNDIIEALSMDFAEGNAFKAIWRKAKARQGVKKKGYDNGVYDSEKVVFFGERMLVKAKAEGKENVE